MSIHILYFASLRETLGVAAEDLETQGDAALTTSGVRELLRARGGVWGEAFAAGQRIMVAVNQNLARAETSVADGDEVAFFPPVTGG